MKMKHFLWKFSPDGAEKLHPFLISPVSVNGYIKARQQRSFRRPERFEGPAQADRPGESLLGESLPGESLQRNSLPGENLPGGLSKMAAIPPLPKRRASALMRCSPPSCPTGGWTPQGIPILIPTTAGSGVSPGRFWSRGRSFLLWPVTARNGVSRGPSCWTGGAFASATGLKATR